MLKTTSKMQSHSSPGFFPFYHSPTCRPFTASDFPGGLAAWWCVPRMWTASLAAVCSSQPSLVCFFPSTSACQPTLLACLYPPWKLDSVCRAGASCQALGKSAATQSINSFLGGAASARPCLPGEMEKSFEEKEISDFGSRSRNLYFRKRSDVINR